MNIVPLLLIILTATYLVAATEIDARMWKKKSTRKLLEKSLKVRTMNDARWVYLKLNLTEAGLFFAGIIVAKVWL